MKQNLSISAAALFAALLALAACGNMIHDLHDKDGMQHTAVTFEQTAYTLVQGGRFQFKAKTGGVYGSHAEDVTWELAVVSGNAPDAKLSADGELSVRLRDAPGAVLAVTARSVRRPEIANTVTVTVAPFFALQGVEDGQAVSVTFTNGKPPMTGTTAGGGVAFDQDDLPGGDWVIVQVEIGTGTTTEVLIGRPAGSVVERGISLKLNGSGGTYTLQHRPAEGGVVPIGSYAEFQLIKAPANLGGTYKQEAELDLLGKTGVGGIGANPDDQNWTPIGGSSPQFQGTFDGDGKDISNLYINRTAYVGLFGYVGAGGVIKDVRIRSGGVSGTNNVGSVAGRNNGGTITGCYNTGDVSGGSIVGGVVGYNDGTITGCSNAGDVSGTGNYVGGVLGSSGSGNITGCSNAGDVSGTSQVGGVAGQLVSGTMTACFNTGDVSGTSYVGGVLGQKFGGDMANCSNAGDVSGTDYVGGVAGYNVEDITGCSNAGDVSGTGFVGGVAGYSSSGNITGCSNTGDVSGTSTYVGGVAATNYSGNITGCSNAGDVSGTSQVGGVSGYNGGGTITGCSNAGDVSGTSQVGGVAGQFVFGTMTACFNTGGVTGTGAYIGGVAGVTLVTITACYNTGPVSGGNTVGGVAGNLSNASSAITACYSSGTVSGGAPLGGLAGNSTSSATVTACYWLYSAGYGDIGTDGGAAKTDVASFASGAFPTNLQAAHPAWGTGSGTTDNTWWKPGTTGGGQPPKLWFE
jgi:hypothetical protein